MAIENLENTDQSNALSLQSKVLLNDKTLIAGTIKVKHPLMDQQLLLIGFVVEDKYFNQNDFQIKGMKIKYMTEDEAYKSINELIYPKIIIDNKEQYFSEYFKTDEEFIFRDDIVKQYFKKEEHHSLIRYLSNRACFDEYSERLYFEFYLFTNALSNKAECAANFIFAVCKYIENGESKHAIFNLHELIPVI